MSRYLPKPETNNSNLINSSGAKKTKHNLNKTVNYNPNNLDTSSSFNDKSTFL